MHATRADTAAALWEPRSADAGSHGYTKHSSWKLVLLLPVISKRYLLRLLVPLLSGVVSQNANCPKQLSLTTIYLLQILQLEETSGVLAVTTKTVCSPHFSLLSHHTLNPWTHYLLLWVLTLVKELHKSQDRVSLLK